MGICDNCHEDICAHGICECINEGHCPECYRECQDRLDAEREAAFQERVGVMLGFDKETE